MPQYTFETRLELPETVEDLLERVKALRKIKDEIDRELAVLTAQEVEIGPRTPWHCVRCDHQWISRLPRKPRQCPICKAKHFDRPPKWRYEDRIRSKEQANMKLPHSVLTRIQEAGTPKVEEITLTPPPTLSLREKLALIYTVNPTEERPLPRPQAVLVQETEEDFVEAINGPDAT